MIEFANGIDEPTMLSIMAAAEELADVFEDNILEENFSRMNENDDIVIQISEQGLKLLGDAFEEIVPEMRAPVFEHLLLELEDRDVEYDISQFQDGGEGDVI